MPAGAVDELQHLLARLWCVRWENEHKEPFWRLVYDALHREQPCLCGSAATPGRQHHFWDCPVARAVLLAISDAAAAGQQPAPAPLSQPNIWLARAPAAIHNGVWDVVSLSAIAAMEKGRRRMYGCRPRKRSRVRSPISSSRSLG